MTTKVTTEIMKVTPKMAKLFLDQNQSNRPLRYALVETYAADMAKGDWQFTAEPVKFDTTGKLQDGQHRLEAIVTAKVPVTLLVVRGLEPEAQEVMDTGLKRAVADALAFRGYSNVTTLAAGARLGVLWDRGVRTTGKSEGRVTHADVLHWVAEHPEMIEELKTVLTYRTALEVRPSVATFTYHEMVKKDEKEAKVFLDKMAYGIELPKGDPVLALRSRLREIEKNRMSIKSTTLVALVFRTWNAWRTREQMAQIPIFSNGKPIPAPSKNQDAGRQSPKNHRG